MKASRLVLVLLGLLVSPLAAQEEHPSKGKIDDVEHSADDAKKKGTGLWFVDMIGDGFHGFWHVFTYVPTQPGQGYQAYPYAAPGDERFVIRSTTAGRTFASVSGAYFADQESSLRAGNFSFEWAGGMLLRSMDYSYYREPRPDGTDHLHLFHVGVAAAPPVGQVGYVKIGLGFQSVFLDTGDAAFGPSLDFGAQLFPRPPFGLAFNGRLAPMTWVGGPIYGVGFAEFAGTGSVFVGRIEIQAGYRWTRIGLGVPFRGPTLGLRAWL